LIPCIAPLPALPAEIWVIILQLVRADGPLLDALRDWFLALSLVSRLFGELTRAFLFEELYISGLGRKTKNPTFVHYQQELATGASRAVHLASFIKKVTFTRWNFDKAGDWAAWFDGHMGFIQKLPALHDLYVDRSQIRPSFFDSLGSLTSLRVLSFNSIEVPFSSDMREALGVGHFTLPPNLDDFYSDDILWHMFGGRDHIEEFNALSTSLLSPSKDLQLSKMVLESNIIPGVFQLRGYQNLQILALVLPYRWNQKLADDLSSFLGSLPNLTTLKLGGEYPFSWSPDEPPPSLSIPSEPSSV
jgi:hypothetical protein